MVISPLHLAEKMTKNFINKTSPLVTNQDGVKNPMFIDQQSNSFPEFFLNY